MAPILSKHNSEKRGETPYTRKTSHVRADETFGDFSLDFDIVDKLSELLNEGLMFAKNFELEENRLYLDWVKRHAYLTDEEDTKVINDNHAIRIDWCNCFINTTNYMLKNLADPKTRDMAMKLGPNILNQLYKYYECMKENPPEEYVASSVVMEEVDDAIEEDEEWDNDDEEDDDDDDDDDDDAIPDISTYTEEDRLLLEKFHRLVFGTDTRYKFNGSKAEARRLRRLRADAERSGGNTVTSEEGSEEEEEDSDVEIIEPASQPDVITIDDDDDDDVDDDDEEDDDDDVLFIGNIDGEEGIPVFGTSHPEVTVTNAKAFEHGKYHVDISGLRMSTFVDVPRKGVTDKDIRSKYRWSNVSKDADKDYFFEMVNGSNCTKQSQTMKCEAFNQDDLLNPLSLAAAMLRKCPCCGEEKAGFNILYPKACQHYICRSCYVNMVDKFSSVGKHAFCNTCGKCINQLFSIVREEGCAGRMVFYNAKLIAMS